jgi:hypothetical protein
VELPWGKLPFALIAHYSSLLLQVRERPKLVKTGPYSIVRHPMYRYETPLYGSGCQLANILEQPCNDARAISGGALGTTSVCLCHMCDASF